ncbi:hypothetical protein PsorP6_010459 [Peronosclerospora sorghi]|uniref:Uncharacterized protein n=1 Tax=Peronosclerospora sorghi TaxID=230839 RepID=A0ACC0VVY8_9STRA|nr:hypothetical protein PsorP6_010459 [Peronosclerospora sorghi]
MARVFVGNLPEDIRERELSDKFDRFGRITSVRIKFPARPPPFAFITYEDEKDASDARFLQWQSPSCRNVSRRGRSTVHENNPFSLLHGRHDPSVSLLLSFQYSPRGTQYRVKIAGLPDTMSWQDLKDFLRKGGDVVHTDVDRRGNGSASFATQEEMRRAIRKLDGTELDGNCVRIRDEETSGRRTSSPSHSRSRTPPRRVSRRRSPSRSRSRSPRRHTSRSNRRDRSRSR